MKKIGIKIVLAFFWGINFIFVLVFGLFDTILPYLIPKLKKEKEIDNIADQSDNIKLFFIVASIPAISILLIALISWDVLLYIAIVYAVGDVIVVLIIMLNRDSHLAFNQKESSVISDFKEFLIILSLNIVGYTIITIIFGAIFIIGFWIFILTDIVLIISLMVLLRRLQDESKVIGKIVENRDLLVFDSTSSHKLLDNIQKVEKVAKTSLEKKKYDLAERYYVNLKIKYEKLIRMYQKSRNKPGILKLKPEYQNIKFQIYTIQKIIYENIYDKKIKLIKSHQTDDNNSKILAGYQELYDLTEERLIFAKKNRSKSDMEKYSQRLTFLKKKME
jgi:hypothetical protein